MFNTLDNALNSLKNRVPKKCHEGLTSVAKNIYPKAELLRKAKTQQSIDEQIENLKGLLSELREYHDTISSDSMSSFNDLLDCLFDRMFCHFRFKTINR